MSCCYPCGPSCVTPSCIQPISSSSCYPVGGLGSLSSCCSPCGGLSMGSGGLSMGGGGGSVSASSLGILAGANVGCVNQTPPSEVVIQPPPFVVIMPGPILSASCEPARVGGYSACGGSGGGGSYLSSGSGLLGSKRSIVCRPC